MFHSRLLTGLGWMLCVVSSLLMMLIFWLVCTTKTCGLYWQPFCSSTAGCCGGWKVCVLNPSETYTTTLANPPSGPTRMSSVVSGVECPFAHRGSCDVSIRVALGGVP